MDAEAAAQLHHAVFAFGKQNSRNITFLACQRKNSADLLRNDNAADRRSDDHVNIGVVKVSRNLIAYRGGVRRILEHAGTLEIVGAVQPRRELEMTFKQRAGAFEQRVYFLVGHGSTSAILEGKFGRTDSTESIIKIVERLFHFLYRVRVAEE